MKKKRTTVYVRPGKDVTLYVPTDTPDEVIQYLNELKREGMFSQGVMDILTSYVQAHRAPGAQTTRVHNDTLEAFISADIDDIMDDTIAETVDEHLEPAATVVPADPTPVTPEAAPAQVSIASEPTPAKKFDLAQIFRQAQYNSGKLTESPE